MTKKQKRLAVIGGLLTVGGIAIFMILFAAQDNLLYFRSPTDIIAGEVDTKTRIRLGGMVEENSIIKTNTTITHFKVTDYAETIEVVYDGILPDLFRECQGVVTEGTLGQDGVFVADIVLAKHDEAYMPPEVAESLKNETGSEIGCNKEQSS